MEVKFNYHLISKRFAGGNLKLLFGQEGKVEKVLILSEVAAFIERELGDISNYCLQIREDGGVYGMDMSMRFKQPAYQTYKEVFLFVERSSPNIVLRALAKEVAWKDANALTAEELNY